MSKQNSILVEATPGALADYIGALRADLANLKDQLAGAEALLKQMVPEGESAEGELFFARVVGTDRTTVNWSKIARQLGASQQMIVGNSKVSHSVSVRVQARKK